MSNGKQSIVFCRICLLRHISVFISTKKLSERLPKRLADFYCVRGKTTHRFLSNMSFVAFKRDFSTNNISWKNCIERGLRIFIVSVEKQRIVFCLICLWRHNEWFFKKTFYGKIALKKTWHIFTVPKRKKSQRFKMMLIFATFFVFGKFERLNLLHFKEVFPSPSDKGVWNVILSAF